MVTRDAVLRVDRRPDNRCKLTEITRPAPFIMVPVMVIREEVMRAAGFFKADRNQHRRLMFFKVDRNQ